MLPQQELTISDYIAMMRRKWPLIAALAVAGCGLGVGLSQTLPKEYTSKTVVLVEQSTVPGDLVKPVVNPDTNVRLATMQEEILSRARIEPVIRKLSLYGSEIDTVPMPDLVARVRKAIEVTPVQPMARTNSPGLPGFSISVTYADPSIAQLVCSTVTSMFLEENLRFRLSKASQTTGFLTSQLEGAKAALDEQDAKLAAFQRAHLGALPDDQELNLNVLGGLATQLEAVTQALARAQQDKTLTEASLAEQRGAWQATLEGRNPETYEQKIKALEAQLAALRSKYTDDYPDVARIKRDIADLRKMAEESAQATTARNLAAKPPQEPEVIQNLRAQVRQYEQQIEDRSKQQDELHRRIRELQAGLQASPSVEQEYKAMTRGYQAALEFYTGLLKTRNQAEMGEQLEQQQQAEQFRILDPANFPDRPSFPDGFLFSLGGLAAGLGVGVGLTLLLEVRDTSVRTDKEIEMLLKMPVLAVVPMLKPSGAQKKRA